MSLDLIILDDRAPFALNEVPEVSSLLLLPLASGTVLSALIERLARLRADALIIAPHFEITRAYRQAIQEIATRGAVVVGRDQLRERVSGTEPSDEFVLVDGRLAPVDDYATVRSILRQGSHERARHLLARPCRAQAAAESVQLGRDGTVERVRRYYDGVTQAGERSVVASAVSAAVLHACPMCAFSTLGEFRLSLAARGIAGDDVESDWAAYDLATEDGYLALHERDVQRSVRRTVVAGFHRMAPDVAAAQDTFVDPRATVMGPVLMHAGARIETGACVIGPVVLARDSRVESGAVVAHSVVAAGSRVPRGGIVRQQYFYPGMTSPGRARRRSSGLPRPQPDHAGAARRLTSPFPAFKRGADIVIAAAGLVLLAPLLAIIAVAIRLTSSGPALFAHEREGRGGRRFRCWKFRTMFQDAHAQQRALYAHNRVDGPQFKLARDPRVTVIGAWLRSTNLDELPQLINVLIGDMSLIGPRPSPFRENQICVPWRQARLSLRPGITGLWQVCRTRRAEGDFHQWIYFDLLYARHVSWALDMKILLATVLTLGGRWSVPVQWLIPSGRLHETMREAGERRGQPRWWNRTREPAA